LIQTQTNSLNKLNDWLNSSTGELSHGVYYLKVDADFTSSTLKFVKN
jgi:hypothetical protein